MAPQLAWTHAETQSSQAARKISAAQDTSTCDPNDEADVDEPDGDECTGTPDPAASNGGVTADTSQTLQCPCGDPIDTTTGNLYEAETDYAGAGPFPLNLTRYYNSLSPLGPSAFGSNWSYRESGHLVVSSDQIQVVKADGKVITFTLSGSAWTSTPNVNSKLEPITSGATITGWKYTTGDDQLETYDAAGKLLSIANRAGLAQTFSYDNKGRLTAVADPFGRTLRLTYDASDRISGATDPAGGAYLYAYDGNNNLVSVTYPNNTVRRYLYEDTAHPHALTGLIDELGNRFATWAYDASGRAVSSQQAGGVGKTTLAFDPNTNTTTVTDALNNVWSYYYNLGYGVGLPAHVKQPPAIGGARLWGYDSNGNINNYVDENGNSTTYTYDATRNLETNRTDPAGNSISTQWHPSFHLPTQTTEPTAVSGVNRVTTYAYDAKGNLLTKTVTAGTQTRQWGYTYNANGQVLTATDPLGSVTRFDYDKQANLSTLTDALGHVTAFTGYNADGRPLTVQDPNGLVVKLAYDERGRLISRATGAETTTYTYDAVGNLTRLTRPDGSFLSYGYDLAHRLTRVTDGLGNHRDFALDLSGNVTAEQIFDATGAVVRKRAHAYDAANRLAQDSGAAGQTTTYVRDGNGNVTKSTDPLGNTTAYERDALNRVTRVTAPDGGVTTIAYNPDGSIASVTDPRSNTTVYGYDGLGNQIAEQSPDRGKITRTFDAAGNVLTSTDGRSLTTTNAYDLLNRLTHQQFSDGTTITFNYDEHATDSAGIGRLTSMVDASGATTFDHDQRGHVIRKRQTVGGVTLTTTNTYDQQTGHLTTAVLPSGAALDYGYNAKSGLPETITVNGNALIGGIEYDPFSDRVKLWGEGDGKVNLYYLRETDQDGNITKVVFGDTSDTHGWAGQRILYTYDDANRLKRSENNDDQPLIVGYDAASRVTDYTTYAPSWEYAQYTYDPNGNRTQAVGSKFGTRTLAIDPFSNRLQAVPGSATANVQYDAGGDLTQDGSYQYTMDARNKLARVSGGGVDVRYAYNGLGERVKKEGSSGATLFVQDGYQVMGEYTATGAPVQETVYLDGLPVGVIKPSGLYYVNPDPIGSPLAITNTAGTLVWSWEHAPFGDTLPNENPKGAGTFSYNLRFPGQYFDSETGYHYNNARAYLPKLGFYQQPDPIGLAGGINPYGYVSNNPLKAIDPYGLYGICANENDNLWDKLLTPEQQKAILDNPILRFIGDNPEIGDYLAISGAAILTLGLAAEASGILAAEEETLTAQQLKSISSYEKRILEHLEKLEKFKANPTIRPGMENLPKEVIEKQWQRRINHLETEIETFMENIEKIKSGKLGS